MWSSNMLELYISYTIHYVAADWTLQSRCLQMLYLPEDHTGVNLAEALTGTFENWGLDISKQSCLATDNGSNICCATHIFKWTRLACFGHSLDLAIANSMKDESMINKAFGVCRKLVSAFSRSYLGLLTHFFVSDCPTQWGSKERMVSKILE